MSTFALIISQEMTKLSVNINKVATIRNARGGNTPNVEQVAIDCEKFGAQGITVHPRPDERHIRYSDVRELKKLVTKATYIKLSSPPPLLPPPPLSLDCLSNFTCFNLHW